MKKIFILLFCVANLFTGNAQDVLLFDFENSVPGGNWPWDAWPSGAFKASTVDDPSFIGNKCAKFVYDATKPSPGWFWLLPGSYNSNDYAGFTAKVKSTYNDLIFTFTLEKQTGGQKGNWSTFPKYTGNGGWVTMQFPFLAAQKDYVFDKLALNPSSHSSLPACEFYFDDVTLVKTFTTGLKNSQYDNTSLSCNGGVLSVKNLNGKSKVSIYTGTGALVYIAEKNADFSVNLKETGVASGVLLITLDNGDAKAFKKVILK